MNKFIIFASFIAVAAAGGSGDVDQALLQRVAQILSSSGGSSGGFGGGFSSGGGYSAPSQSYSAPSQSYSAPSQSYSAPSSSYGAPQGNFQRSSSGGGRLRLGSPQRAPQLATFDLETQSQGGYSAPSQSYSAPSASYGAPQATRSSGGGRIQLGSPQRAQQLATFDLSAGGFGGGSSRGFGGGSYSAPARNGGPY